MGQTEVSGCKDLWVGHLWDRTISDIRLCSIALSGVCPSQLAYIVHTTLLHALLK